MRIHSFCKVSNVTIDGGDLGMLTFPNAKCRYCGRLYGLNEEELMSLPTQMARCPNGRELSLRETIAGLIRGCFNCWEGKQR